MRDYFVALVVFGSLIPILMRPHLGIVIWSWLSYMNPHRLGWGFALNFPFAQIVAITTLVAMVLSKESYRVPWTPETITLVLFVLWMSFTTLFALEADQATIALERVLKIQLVTFLTLMIMFNRERLHLVLWTVVMSLGFYGIKGGIFTILTGGSHHVWGPLGTFIGGNNELGLALIMTLPLMRYLQLQSDKRWVKRCLVLAMVLTIFAIAGTQSRGALVGLVAMTLLLVWRDRQRVRMLVLLAMLLLIAFLFMPDSWHERMQTINTYEEDSSAIGRINAWHFAFNLANDRPLVGGGFEVFEEKWFGLYAPNPLNVLDAHSIYFEVLGEHGYVGLGLFLLLLYFAWSSGTSVIKYVRGHAEWTWAGDLARMLQVSLVGYMASGAFLGLAYFDLYYAVVAMMVVTKTLVFQALGPTRVASRLRKGPGHVLTSDWKKSDTRPSARRP